MDAAHPELNPWEQAGVSAQAQGTSAVQSAQFKQAKEIQDRDLKNKLRLADIQAQTSRDVAKISGQAQITAAGGAENKAGLIKAQTLLTSLQAAKIPHDIKETIARTVRQYAAAGLDDQRAVTDQNFTQPNIAADTQLKNAKRRGQIQDNVIKEPYAANPEEQYLLDYAYKVAGRGEGVLAFHLARQFTDSKEAATVGSWIQNTLGSGAKSAFDFIRDFFNRRGRRDVQRDKDAAAFQRLPTGKHSRKHGGNIETRFIYGN